MSAKGDGEIAALLVPPMTAVLFWLMLNWMFNPVFAVGTYKDLSLENVLSAPDFIVLLALALVSAAALWRFVIPMAKKSGSPLAAYVFANLPLLFGFTAAFLQQAITPYYYFLPVALAMYVYAYFEMPR